MSEFHEVECPDQIGRDAGCGRSAGGELSLQFPPLMWGKGRAVGVGVLREGIFLPDKIIECCCIFIIYYCWTPPRAYLLSRADEMPTFVKISCSAAEGRLPPDRVVLLLSFSDIFGFDFCWPAAEFVVVALAPLRPFRHFALKS